MRLLTRTFIFVIVLLSSFVFFASSHAQESPVVCTDQPLQQGQTLYAAQDYNGAIVAYTCALQSAPNNAAIYNRRGNAYRQLGDYAAALTDYNRAVELAPDNALILNNRGWVHYQLDQLDLALADFNNALKNDPQLAEAYNNRGLVYARQAQYAQALADFNQASELGLETDWATYNKGAINEFAQAAVTSYNARGKAAYDQKDYETAIANYKLAREIDPNNYEANYGLVDAYYNLPDYASAQEVVEFLLKKWPDKYDVQFAAGLVYKQLGQYNEAIAAFSKALELASDSQKLGLYVLRGIVYDYLDESQKAIEDNTRAIEIAPQSCAAYNNRAYIYQKMGDYEAALADFSKAVELDPTASYPCKPSFYTARGYVYYLTEEYEKALADFEQAKHYRPDEAYAYLYSSLTYTAMGEAEKAQADFQKWLSLHDVQSLEDNTLQPDKTRAVEMAENRLYELTFEGKAGQAVTLTATKTGQLIVDPFIILYSPDGLPLATDDDSGDRFDALVADFALPDDGTYTIAVTHAGAGSVGTIEVQLEITTP